jgi:hypothetical protein
MGQGGFDCGLAEVQSFGDLVVAQRRLSHDRRFPLTKPMSQERSMSSVSRERVANASTIRGIMVLLGRICPSWTMRWPHLSIWSKARRRSRPPLTGCVGGGTKDLVRRCEPASATMTSAESAVRMRRSRAGCHLR